MSFFTLNGTPYDVVATEASESARVMAGSVGWTFLGTLQSTEHAPKRVITVGLWRQGPAAMASLAALVALGARVTVGGWIVDPVGTATIVCTGRIESRTWAHDKSYGAPSDAVLVPVLVLTEA